MWILKGPEGKVHYFLPGKHVIGRKNCDLVLDNDQSISRTHAVIEVSHPQSSCGNPDQKPTLNLFDAGSKYGTSLIIGNNTIKMEKDVKKNLEEGVVIHFGLLLNKWQLHYEPLVVLVSSLPKVEKQKFRAVICDIGGHMVSDWHNQTTHLTMTHVTMTVKAISALAHAIPIVTPGYWLSYKSAIKSKSQLPKCEDYVPPIGETVLNEHKVSFLVNPKRKSLFHGKIFYFFSELQFKDHSCMVQAAGGVAKLVRAVRQSQLTKFVEKNAIAMQLLSTSSQTMTLSQNPEAFTEVSDFLKLNSKRLIPASEIGLAVLHCSVEKYCNPDFNFSSMLLQDSQETQPPMRGRILATETQENYGPSMSIIGEGKVIPDSGSESKVGLSVTVEENPIISNTQKLLQNSQPAAQLKKDISQTQEQQQSISSLPPRRFKRVRAIEESDDEVEILSPRKLPTGASSVRQNNPIITLKEESIDFDVSTVSTASSKSRSSRLHASKASHHSKDSEDPDELFADFKESLPKARKLSNILQEPSPDMNADDIFTDFQNDVKVSAGPSPVKPPEVPKSLQSTSNTVHSMSPACKRSLPTDDENRPPEKRFAQLDLSERHVNKDGSNSECIEFLTSCVKTEDESFNTKPSGNVSVVFKPLVAKSKKPTVSVPETSPESAAVVNYKKFRKVNLLSSIIPRIIGGTDLQPYQSVAGNSSVLKNSIDEANESEEEDGPNSLWEALTQSNSKQAKQTRLPVGSRKL